MIDYLKELNNEQYRAVMAEDGPILVIAGAGSGKTRTLTYRVARLIESGIGPERILLATFTNKAAREMLYRVERLTGVDVSRLWGGTFHHIANLILRREASRLGFMSNFGIIDENDANQLVNTCISDMQIDPRADGFPKGNIVRDIFSFSINTGRSLVEVAESKYPALLHWTDALIELADRYLKKKREGNVLDFDDLLLNWRDLMRDFEDVRKYYAEKFRHVLVDEYQDTNLIQAELIDLLASRHRCLMAVGDDSQSIYSFRGADSDHILRFPDRYPDAKIYKLETNYRSTPEILHLANQSIRNNELQFQKELRAVRNSGIRPVLMPTRNVNQQANFVAQRIIELVHEGVPLKEIAVLYRAHYHAMELQMEMTRRGIPFEIRSGLRFFEQAHIKDIAAYLRIISNPLDETAWKRAFSLYPGVGKTTSEKLWKYVMSQEDPLASVVKEEFLKCAGKKARNGLAQLSSLLQELQKSLYLQCPARMISCILDGGYRKYLQVSYPDFQSREDDLNQLAAYAQKFSDLHEFLSELALFANMAENEKVVSDADGEKIILTTVHQAKGLEWSAVFIIWCAEGMMPLARALREEGGLEEERRLFYVATTRAKDLLYFCHPLVDYGRGQGTTVVSPSRFIQELKPERGNRFGCPYDQWVVDEIW
jgi:DNA helicase-2/ATP-dependent DNA helicase PcrA